MRKLLLLLTMFTYNLSHGQIVSGSYSGYGTLDLAFERQTKRVTGNYQFYSGFDLKAGIPRFTCNFYIDGILINNQANIIAYIPLEKESVNGVLTINDKGVTLSLNKQIEGCWNAEYLTNKPTVFTLDEQQAWVSAKYITTPKAFFYSTPDNDKQSKAYVLKGDIIFIDSIKGDRAHCTYFGGKKKTIGWIKTTNLNN